MKTIWNYIKTVLVSIDRARQATGLARRGNIRGAKDLMMK